MEDVEHLTDPNNPDRVRNPDDPRVSPTAPAPDYRSLREMVDSLHTASPSGIEDVQRRMREELDRMDRPAAPVVHAEDWTQQNVHDLNEHGGPGSDGRAGDEVQRVSELHIEEAAQAGAEGLPQGRPQAVGNQTVETPAGVRAVDKTQKPGVRPPVIPGAPTP